MNFDKPLNLKPCCLNLRHKMMYCDPRQAQPGLVDDESDTRIYVCVLTQESTGPDRGVVHPRSCGSGRECYRAPVFPTINGSPSASGNVA